MRGQYTEHAAAREISLLRSSTSFSMCGASSNWRWPIYRFSGAFRLAAGLWVVGRDGSQVAVTAGEVEELADYLSWGTIVLYCSPEPSLLSSSPQQEVFDDETDYQR